MNSEVKRLIESYIIHGDEEEMRKNMQSVGESEEENEKSLKQAIQFVDNNKKEIEETGIEQLTFMLIVSIRNRVTVEYWSDCLSWYIVGREGKPTRYCNLCNIGMHDCQDDKKGYRKGDMWLCSDCHEQFTQQIKPQIVKKYRNITVIGFSDDKPEKDVSVTTEMEI